jgi:hypothetical protein
MKKFDVYRYGLNQGVHNTNLRALSLSCCPHFGALAISETLSLQFLNRKTVGRTPLMGDEPIARPLPYLFTYGAEPFLRSHGLYLYKQNKQRRPCLEWDSTPRPQRSIGRRQYLRTVMNQITLIRQFGHPFPIAHIKVSIYCGGTSCITVKVQLSLCWPRSSRFTLGEDPWYPSNRRLGGPLRLSGRCGEENPGGNRPPVVQPVALSTELSSPLYYSLNLPKVNKCSHLHF